MLNRIAIVGGSGAGKTTISLALGEATGLPVYHTDSARFLPGWKPRARIEINANLAEIACGDRWIIDGTDIQSLESRIHLADVVVFLHVPTHIRGWRVIKRMISGYKKQRVGLSEGCKGRLSFRALRWAFIGYKRIAEPKLLDLIEQVKGPTQVIHVHTISDHAQLTALFPHYRPGGWSVSAPALSHESHSA